ncbi:MAG: hypothetical protein EBQ49_03075, partial [Verrucomicrobia bacterium]|nr:hypothetical protein [Verrucomicrobiota bacterium]
MVRPRQKHSINRVNSHWLFNAASLVVALGAINQVSKSGVQTFVPQVIPNASAVDYVYAGGTEVKAGPIGWWTGSSNPKANGTSTDASIVTFTVQDNLWFESSAAVGANLSWSSSIGLGSSNISALSLNFVSGAPSYTISASHTKKLNTGSSASLANQTNPQINNASSSAITFAVIVNPVTGGTSTSAAVFSQSNPLGSLNFIGSTAPSSYIMNPYAYDWALSTGSTAAQAKTFAGSTTAQMAIAAGNNSSGRYVNFTGQGTITVGASIGDQWRGNGGSNTSNFSVSGFGNIVILNTGTTNLNGWNTYTGTTQIGDGTKSGGTVVIGTPYAFGGNRLADRTSPYNLVNTAPGGTSYTEGTGTNAVNYTLNAYMVGGTSAYSATGQVGAAGGAGTIATGFSYTTQAFGAVTVNSGFTVDLNGVTMLGANPMTINGSGAASAGVIKNSSNNTATYAGLITVGNTSTMSVGYGNIILAGGVNTTSKTLTIDGASNTYITGPITGSSGGRIQKLGNGTLTISGTNTSPGTLKVVTGNVVISSPDALSSTGILDSGGSTGDTGTLILTGGLVNSSSYQTGSLTPGGNLNISTVNGPSTITFTSPSGSGQSGSVEKWVSINSQVTAVMTGTFDINTSTTANRYFRINGDGNFIFNGEIRNNSTGVTTSTTGAGGLNRSTQGSGVLTLNGANTFTGGVILGGGTINLGSAENAGTNGPLGASGSIVLNGGYLQYSANNQYDYSSRFDNANSSPQKYNVDTNGQNVTWATSLTSANGSLTKIGNGTLTLSATNSYGGGTTLQAGVLQLNNSNSLGTSGTITLSGGTLQYTVNDTNDYSSRFSTAASQKYNFDTNGVNVTAATALTSLGGTLTKSGNGILTLGGSNTYTGDTTVNQGTLTAGIVGALSSSSAVVVSSGATLNLNSNNQTLKGLAGAGTVTMGTANLTIADGDSRTFSGDISGSGNLIKSGSGTQTLSAAVTYTGSTAINAGTLRVNNSLASSSITVDGSATLTGKGTITGSVTVSSNGIITAGDTTLADASRGALTLSALTFSGTGVINLANVNTNSSSSILNVGALSALGGVDSIVINISNSTPLADNSTFTLLSYTSLDNFLAFKKGTISGTYDRQIKTIVNDSTNKLITLTTTGDTLKWTGGTSLTPVWTTAASNQNWKLSSSNTVTDYLASDIVAFDDTASIYVVTLGEDVSPGSLTFDNSTNAYSVNSSSASTFGITGAANLIKNGSARVDINAPLKTTGGIAVNNGTLALNNSTNTFSGNIALNGAGNLEVGATGALGTSNSLSFGSNATGKLSLNGYNVTLTGLSNNSSSPGSPIIENGSSTTNSTLTLNLTSGTSTFDGLIRNGGANTLALTKTGAGKLILTADNTATGLTTISAGTLQLGNGGSTGAVSGDISIGSGGTLSINLNNSLYFNKVISGSGTFNVSSGQLELLGTNTFTGTMAISSGATVRVGTTGSISSSLTLTNNGTFQYNSTSTASIGAVSGSGSLSVLSSTLTQSGTNSLTGSIAIAAGATYSIGTNGSFTSASGMVNDGTLSFSSRTTDYTLATAISGLGNVIFNPGGRIIYLTGNNTYTGTTTLSSGTLNVGNGSASGQLGTGAVTLNTGSELILTRSSDSTIYGPVSGGGKLTLGGSGKVTLDSNSSINITNDLKVGTSAGSAVHASLDLSAASASVGKFTVQTDATSNPSSFNNIVIGSGKNLNVSGLVTIGLDNGSNPTTNLTISGDGSLNIGTLASPTNADVKIGANITSSRINYVNWDMSALANLTMYLGTGTFNIGADVNGTGTPGGTGSGDTVKLATTSTIVGTTLLMDAVTSSRTFTLSLGSGVNTINVDTLTVSGANTRATSNINFNSGTGSLIVRSKSGGRAALNIQSATNSTGSNQIGSIDLSGHSADLFLGTVTVGSRVSLIGSGSGFGSGYLAFDTGTFDASTLNIANKSHNGSATGNLSGKTLSSFVSGNLIGLVSFGGGTVTLGTVDVARHGASNVGGTVQGLIEFLGSNTSSIGAVTLATASSSVVSGTSAATAYLNVADGAVTVASISGASAANNTVATANVNLSGGTLTLGGNITRTGASGTGTSAFNFNLSGGILDMGGFSIGSSTSPITFNWTKGTLKNVSGLNGTAGITVNTGDQFTPVYLAGTNTFTSTITIKDSVLQLDSNTALAAGSKIGFDGTLGILKLGSGITTDVSTNLVSGNAQFDTYGNNVTFNNSVTGLTSFSKLGSGKLILSATGGALAPTVSVIGGTLQIGSGDNLIPVGGFLNGTTALYLDAVGGSPELIANGVKVDLNADVHLVNSGTTISGSKGSSSYSFNFIKDIISSDNSAAT